MTATFGKSWIFLQRWAASCKKPKRWSTCAKRAKFKSGRSLFPFPTLCVGVPNTIGEQPIQIGKVRIAVDEEVQAFAIVLARPLAVPQRALRSDFGIKDDWPRVLCTCSKSRMPRLRRPILLVSVPSGSFLVLEIGNPKTLHAAMRVPCVG